MNRGILSQPGTRDDEPVSEGKKKRPFGTGQQELREPCNLT